jgi:TonB family protein
MNRIYAGLFIALSLATPRAWGEVRVKHLIGMEYPRLARLARVQGTVELIVSVSPTGTVRDIRSASGPSLLIPPTKDVMKQWTFDGCDTAQGCEFRVVFSFSLTEGACVVTGPGSASQFEVDLPDHIQVKARELCAIVN